MAVWSITTPPAVEPILLADAKNYLRIHSSVTADDDLIDLLIVQARQYVERVINRGLITQTVTEYFDKFPDPDRNSLESRLLKLHLGPVSSVTSVSYIAEGDTPSSYTVWDNTGNSKYFLDLVSGGTGIGPARICKKKDVDWPVIEPYTNAVKVIYDIGYGAAASSIPGPLTQAMHKLIGRWYYHPDEKNDFDLVADLLNPYKLHK